MIKTSIDKRIECLRLLSLAIPTSIDVLKSVSSSLKSWAGFSSPSLSSCKSQSQILPTKKGGAGGGGVSERKSCDLTLP